MLPEMENKTKKLHRTWKPDFQRAPHSPSPPTLLPGPKEAPDPWHKAQLTALGASPALPHTEDSVRGGISKYHQWGEEGNAIPENVLEDHSD